MNNYFFAVLQRFEKVTNHLVEEADIKIIFENG